MRHHKSTILLLEDDRLFAETLTDFLEEEGYGVETVHDPYSAMDRGFASHYDLYLFDVNLPFESGFDLLKKLRDGDDRTPVIFLTSRSDKASLLEGFAAGGDDYLRKPVDLEELRARIEAVLRRREGRRRIAVGDYEMDVVAKMLYRDGEPVELGGRLFDLLHLLVGAHGDVVPTDRILMELWSREQEGSYGALRVYITRLKKLFGDRIENVRGVGYRYVEKAEDA